MARIDSGPAGPIISAKRGHRPVKLIHPHPPIHHAAPASQATARKHQRAVAKTRARQRFAAAFTAARTRAKGQR